MSRRRCRSRPQWRWSFPGWGCCISFVVAVKARFFCQPGPGVCRGFFVCARQGVLTSWLESNAHPARGSASRTARVSTARWNLKEAVSKTLVRRTGSTYEAAAADERAQRLKVHYLHGSCGSICDGDKRGSQCAIPGEISAGAIKLARSQGRDEAAGEVSRGHSRSARD